VVKTVFGGVFFKLNEDGGLAACCDTILIQVNKKMSKAKAGGEAAR
jgi:hypothetical protein